MDEDALLQQALAMSMTADEPAPAADSADGGANGSAPHMEQVRRCLVCSLTTRCPYPVGTGQAG